jgi:teichuronic acid biosynthesis glycosyltransferase TuaC
MRDDKLRVLACSGFPSPLRPSHQPFVRELLVALAGQGADVAVIAPESAWRAARAGGRPPRFEVYSGLPVHRPRFLSFSEVALPVVRSTGRWSDAAYRRAALRAAGGLGPVDVCFGHFLYPHGQAAAAIAARRGVPAVLSLGESSFRRYERAYTRAEMAGAFARFRAIVANSPVLEAQLTERYGVPKGRVTVLPNGVDERRFRPEDRATARRRLGLPAERPILACVGHWNERKGPLRVMEAIRGRPDIGAVFLGTGPQRPSGPQVLHAGPVPHEDVPAWLSAADLFVLPTLDEGCSNALLEALACGLPLVTSDRPFNRAVVDDSVARLVEPGDPAAIGAAIAALVDRPDERARLAAAALAHARAFSLERRAARILALLRDVAGA